MHRLPVIFLSAFLLAGCGVSELRSDLAELKEHQQQHEKAQRAHNHSDIQRSHRAASQRLDRHTD